MNPKLIKTLLIAGAIGFFIMWLLELQRTDIKDSYWLILLCITCLLSFQYYRIKIGETGIPTGEKPKDAGPTGTKKASPTKRKRK
ncbi:hypothetical protein [Telluribacter sp. SYSU D00476]|uniref:hypothetical protein n=1 Tax=Telluribacter sp. SYSU D00476 TaxID=2811430 RepID=UPI001FF15F0F|nr:hypothetical protein [Telluribacter sp. SYSU D00476]